MPHQPSQSVATPTSSTAAAVYLVVSAFAAAGLCAMVYVDLATALEPSRPAGALLAFVGAVGGYGYINRSAEDRASRREADTLALILDRIDALDKRADGIDEKIIEQGERGYAAGFVDGAAGNRRHLTAVGDA